MATNYRLTFDRIGRDHNAEPAEFRAADADDLAEKVYRYVRPRLASRFPDVVVDLDKMDGFVSAGVHVAGRFTIEVVTGGEQHG